MQETDKTRPRRARRAGAIKLPADLGIEQAGALYATLVARVDDPVAVTLDAAEVSRVHAAALQLFCMFCRDRRAGGRETHWRRPSASLTGAAAAMGVSALLSLPSPTA